MSELSANEINTYEKLHALVQEAVEKNKASDKPLPIRFTLSDNNTCTVIHSAGPKITFMLARLMDEYRVGFAFYEYQRQPEWIEDIAADECNLVFVERLLQANLGDIKDNSFKFVP